MKLTEEYRRLLREKKIRYDMKNVNGGFSGGVDIKPGQDPGVMNISINIYGGSQSIAHPYQVPQRIKELQEAYAAARQSGDPSSEEFKTELREYYNNLKRAISLYVVKSMQQFDEQASVAIQNAIQQINAKYQ